MVSTSSSSTNAPVADDSLVIGNRRSQGVRGGGGGGGAAAAGGSSSGAVAPTCQSCHGVLAEGAVFCHLCGAPQSTGGGAVVMLSPPTRL
jgi:cytochrome c553